jgi:hypothetical protein
MSLYDIDGAIDNAYEKYIKDKKNFTLKEKFFDKLEDIKIWYNHLFIFDILYNIKNGIKNFWKYRNIIWKDRWYDYSYIFKLLEFKLKDTIKNWEGAHYVGSEFTRKRMQVLLNRIEEYNTNLENLQELFYQKKISKSEYIVLKDDLLNKTWKSFGRNITRFWD